MFSSLKDPCASVLYTWNVQRQTSFPSYYNVNSFIYSLICMCKPLPRASPRHTGLLDTWLAASVETWKSPFPLLFYIMWKCIAHFTRPWRSHKGLWRWECYHTKACYGSVGHSRSYSVWSMITIGSFSRGLTSMYHLFGFLVSFHSCSYTIYVCLHIYIHIHTHTL